MREIKFRAWQKQYEEMYQPLDGYIEFPDIVVGFSDGNLRLDKDDVTLQQFTGLLDKNGKEIYEGDIVKRRYLNDVSIIEVVFYKGSFNLDAQNGNCSFEVIGNIFENKYLLK